MYLDVYECLSSEETEKASGMFMGDTSHKAGTSIMLGGYDFILNDERLGYVQGSVTCVLILTQSYDTIIRCGASLDV